MERILLFIATTLTLGGCAVVSTPPQSLEMPAPRVQQQAAQKAAAVPELKSFKRKVAISRFTNETRYGRTFLTDANSDPLGKQASDMLATRLVASNKFLVFERQDLNKIKDEQKITQQSDLIGVDTLILGSVTEFGRSTTGKSGFLSATKIQTAKAKVEIKLVDARTGYVFFTASGSGEANTESGEVAGFGSKADYDSTLNDRAIGAAISDVQNTLMSKLDERPWRTDILKVEGKRIFISGGKRQGLKIGDLLAVIREGDKIKSAQTGFQITLPGTTVASLRVVALFGDAESDEGAIGDVLSGSLPANPGTAFYVTEPPK